MRAIVAGSVVALCVIGCGGGGGGGTPTGRVCDGESTTPLDMPTDYAPSFTGIWLGTIVTTIGSGSPNTGYAHLTLTSSKKNLLGTDICPGMPALVTGADGFDTVCYICAPMKVTGCDSMVITYKIGSGTLSSAGARLDASLSGTVTGCGTSADFTQVFTDATRAPALRAGQSDAAEPVSLSDLVMQAAASAR